MPAGLVLMAAFYASTGVWHFTRPSFFLTVMPPWVPWPRAMNALAGAAELALAAGLCFEPSRRAALLGIIVLLVAVFPVHIHMLRDKKAGHGLAPWILWARLPAQAVLILWALLYLS